MKVGEICSRSVLGVEASASVREAAVRMRDNGVSALAVFDSGRGVGVITERDLAHVVAAGGNTKQVRAGDCASHDAWSVPWASSVREAVRMMIDLGVRHLPVTDDGDVVGVVSVRDIVRDIDAESWDGEPHLRAMADRKVAFVRAAGPPADVAADVLPGLYASFSAMQDVRDASAGTPSPIARWTNRHAGDGDGWLCEWALPVPGDVERMPQPTPGVEVSVDTWRYGTVAEIVRAGEAAEAARTAQLERFIDEVGFEIVGPHEQEFLTPPGDADGRTIVRYVVAMRH